MTTAPTSDPDPTPGPARPASTRARPAVVGHRGAPAHAPENTLAGFRRAMADGAELLECDVHLSADGHVVILHDETVDRTAEAGSPRTTGAVGELTRAELAEVRVGEGEGVPTLDELLAITTVPVFVEVKAVAAAAAVARMLRELPAGSPAAASTVISFHPEALARVRTDAPDVPVSLLLRVVDEQGLATAVSLGAAGIGPAVDGMSLAAAAAVRDAGIAVHPWTVGRPEQLAVALACGASSITTDDPAWVHRELDAAGL